jgi:hypothetical protein
MMNDNCVGASPQLRNRFQSATTIDVCLCRSGAQQGPAGASAVINHRPHDG